MFDEAAQPTLSPADMEDAVIPLEYEIAEQPDLADEDIEITPSFLPASFHSFEPPEEFFAEPSNLLRKQIYIRGTGRRCRDWYLALVTRVAGRPDQYLDVDLTHEITYPSHSRPRTALAHKNKTEFTELVDLRARQHGKTFFLLVADCQSEN